MDSTTMESATKMNKRFSSFFHGMCDLYTEKKLDSDQIPGEWPLHQILWQPSSKSCVSSRVEGTLGMWCCLVIHIVVCLRSSRANEVWFDGLAGLIPAFVFSPMSCKGFEARADSCMASVLTPNFPGRADDDRSGGASVAKRTMSSDEGRRCVQEKALSGCI